MNLDLFFPTTVWTEQTELDNTDMLKLCYKLQEEKDNSRVISNQGGWQSNDIRPNTHAEMKPLYDKIMAQAQQCMEDYGYDTQQYYPVMQSFWFNINKKGHSNRVHTHAKSFISGVYYLKADSTQGALTIYRNFSDAFFIESAARQKILTPLSACQIGFQPKSSQLILFPSSLPHSVEINNTEEDRVSMSFNVHLVTDDVAPAGEKI